MTRSHGLIAATLAAGVLAAATANAANTCPAFDFIYQQKFDYGDGEGFETHSCKEANFKIGDKVHNSMQDAIKSNLHQRAQAELSKALSVNKCVSERECTPDTEMCVRPALQKSFQTQLELMAKQNAATAEKASQFTQAIDINNTYCLYDESARIYRARTKAQPLDLSFHNRGVEFAKARGNQSLLADLQQIANANTKNLMAQENKIFTSGLYAANLLDETLKWVPYTSNNKLKNETLTLAEKRGDTLIARDGCLPIAPAIEYYEVAGNAGKIKQAKSRALKFGEQFEKQGSLPAAAGCYEIADADNKSSALRKQSEAQREKNEAEHQKSEKVRKEKFSKEADDLEKELGI